MNINFISMGKIKESCYREACAEYVKRLGGFAAVKCFEPPVSPLPAEPSDALVQKALSQEAARIREHIKPASYTAALCVEGKELSSEELAQMLSSLANRGISTINFVVGSSCGLDEGLKREADFRLSMSRMTLPHSLARVVLYEQVYRAFSIIAGSKYHK